MPVVVEPPNAVRPRGFYRARLSAPAVPCPLSPHLRPVPEQLRAAPHPCCQAPPAAPKLMGCRVNTLDKSIKIATVY